METCIGCGVEVPVVDGPTHRYLGASPGCWAWYGEVLAREYENAAFFEAHWLTVDAYAVQHPGDAPTPQRRRSTAIHLKRLCLTFERGLTAAESVAAMRRLASNGQEPPWLEPPTDMGPLTVVDVRAAPDAAAHKALVRDWAESAWTAWAPHHETVRGWLDTTS